jgi:hypothetical protein
MYLQLKDENNLEVGSKEPKLNVLFDEIEQALTDTNVYYRRCQDAYNYWHARWPNQTVDGRKHARADGTDVFPWENASDTRVRLCEGLVQKHVTIAQTTFFRAKVQATSVDPFLSGREANQGTTLLKWMLYSHMRTELLLEVPLAFNWWAGYGAALMRVGWRQEERVQYHELSLPVLDEFIQKSGGPPSMDRLMSSLLDPDQEDALTKLVLQLSPALNLKMARKIVVDLRTQHTAQIPVPYPFLSQPCWTARRLGVDVLVPRSTRDLQSTRWVTEREWVSETDLRSRALTEEYRDDFVEELLRHRGETDNATWTARTAYERQQYGGAPAGGYNGIPTEFRNQFELFHTYYKAIDDSGRPCVYKTTYSPAVMSRRRDKPLYAKHGYFEYDHGMYPFTALRFEMKEPELMSSRGVPELAYTWEDEIKTQRDGRTDATALVHRPPMIVPFMRQQAIRNTPIPGSVFGVTRPNEISWMPQPQQSNQPIEIERTIMALADDFFGIFGAEVDQDWKNLRREELVNYVLGWLALTGDQTFQLLQQYEADDEVTAVVGQLKRPFHVDKLTIIQKHQISATFDSKELDQEYATKKAQAVIQIAQATQSGRIDVSQLDEVLLEILDPVIADRVLRPADEATEKETKDEQAAITSAMSGIEVAPPKIGNFQLRLQVLTQTLQNPQIMQDLRQKPFSQQILEQRFKYYTNQVQQFQKNPQIGRTLATSAMDPTKALPTTSQAGVGS